MYLPHQEFLLYKTNTIINDKLILVTDEVKAMTAYNLRYELAYNVCILSIWNCLELIVFKRAIELVKVRWGYL